MLPYVKFAEDNVLIFIILSVKCENSATLNLTLILTSIADYQINRNAIVERDIVVE